MCMSSFSANISEIFSSIQGEGPYIGHKQIFVRFSGCNFSCRYCDTDTGIHKFCKIYDINNNYKKTANPVDYRDLLEITAGLKPGLNHSISFTGGEPLLQAEFINKFLDEFTGKFPYTKTYLETNGILADEMKLLIDKIDIVSMDIKLESSTKAPIPFKEHAGFIKALNSFNGDFFIKIIINENITQNEISRVKELMSFSKKRIQLILQPQSKQNLTGKLPDLQNEFLKDLKDVRIIAQMHKYLNLK